MSRAEPPATGFRFTGGHMLACMLAFFGIIVAVNLGMAIVASSSWTGLVVKSSYVASQKFNGQLAEARRQSKAGLQSKISYSTGTLSVKITDRDGTALTPGEASLWIGRPAFEEHDRTLPLICDEKGLCSAGIELGPGPWALRIDALVPDGAYRRDARIIVGADNQVRVE